MALAAIIYLALLFLMSTTSSVPGIPAKRHTSKLRIWNISRIYDINDHPRFYNLKLGFKPKFFAPWIGNGKPKNIIKILPKQSIADPANGSKLTNTPRLKYLVSKKIKSKIQDILSFIVPNNKPRRFAVGKVYKKPRKLITFRSTFKPYRSKHIGRNVNASSKNPNENAGDWKNKSQGPTVLKNQDKPEISWKTKNETDKVLPTKKEIPNLKDNFKKIKDVRPENEFQARIPVHPSIQSKLEEIWKIEDRKLKGKNVKEIDAKYFIIILPNEDIEDIKETTNSGP